ncbi:hypothetical protein P152DRAFT_377880, partial [Eremomyces bilateralis CBS 781.70]
PSGNSPSSHSLAAAATMNAGIQTDEARRSTPSSPLTHSIRNRGIERRRSGVRMNLNLNDPAIPGPGEMAVTPGSVSRHGSIGGGYTGFDHHRAPSLGELHQELENEQEAQVNRLLAHIRQQQAQIATLQSSTTSTGAAIDDSTPTSERSMSLPQPALSTQPTPAIDTPHGRGRGSLHRSTSRPRSPFNHPASGARSRTSSYGGYNRTPSISSSPRLRPTSVVDEGLGIIGGLERDRERDEAAFYQAETQNLTRENQMLKLRIRELERQLNDSSLTGSVAHSPSIPSQLHSSLEEAEE